MHICTFVVICRTIGTTFPRPLFSVTCTHPELSKTETSAVREETHTELSNETVSIVGMTVDYQRVADLSFACTNHMPCRFCVSLRSS